MRSHMYKRLAVAALIMLSVSCSGGGSTSSSGPTTPSPTPGPATIPDFQGGLWSGNSTQQCTETGGTEGTEGSGCGLWSPRGRVTFELRQTGTSVVGTVSIGITGISVSGIVGSDQALTMSGQPFTSLQLTQNVTNWRSTITGRNSMSGEFTYTLVPDDPRRIAITLRIAFENATRITG